MSEIAVILSAIFLGILTGVLPGVGPTLIVLMLMPVLFQLDLISLFLFYVILISTSQYYGSVSAIIYGVTGEVSSLPAVRHGHPLYLSGRGSETLALTSTASFIASLLGISIIAVAQHYSEFFVLFFKQSVLLSIYIVVLVLLIVLTKNKVLSLAMLLIGLVLQKLGFDALYDTNILLPKYSEWQSGIPFYSLFAGFVMFPILLDCMKSQTSIEHRQENLINIKPIERLRLLLRFPELGSVTRGSVIGSFVGLVPGASYMFSSNFADKIESRFSRDPMKRLVAAEAANNSGSITVLLPLFFLAVPIVPSESVILSIAESLGFGTSVGLSFVDENLSQILILMLLANVANWLLAGYFYQILSDIYCKMQKYVYHVLLVSCAGVLLWVAWLDHNLMVSIMVFLVILPLGMMIRNVESKFVLLFGFFMSDFIIDEFYRFFIIYF